MSVRVKICGLTRAVDVQAALDAGADAIGLVFAGGPRALEPAVAAPLAAQASGRALRVALFLDPDEETVRGVLDAVEIDLLQFHGMESNAFCAGFGRPFIKAVPVADAPTGRDPGEPWPDATGILYDAHRPGGRGGTGRSLNWSELPGSAKPVWLAGGLAPGNVARAIRAARPWAVDVSSGVEAAPGIKDHDRIRRFIEEARNASNEREQ